MILVDTSVWIDFFKASGTKYHLTLHYLIEQEEDISLADIILTEILQGIREDRKFRQTEKYLLEFPIYSLKDFNSYVKAAHIYRACRKIGLTIRRPIDCIIARIALENGLFLFHNDRDFDTIAKVIKGLKVYQIPPRLK